ncbi:MAG: cytochrome o ubiquinol oxidase subunit IV [Gammaproteobacteria bacterium]|jgi:cytochrome o ubiquinol oxidase subunit IV
MEPARTEDAGGREATLGSYLTGFALALVLTVIPFGLVVTGDALPRWLIVSVIFLAAIAQVLVHLYYFLHLKESAGERWNLPVILFTTLILVILAGGTVWIMVNLHRHMIPT